MEEIGLREMKTRASELVRQVRERRASYVVTHRGRPVAKLVPLTDSDEDELREGGSEMLRLMRTLQQTPLPPGAPTVQEIFDEMRR